MAEHKKHLYYIDELSDYKIADGYPDVRGWELKDFDHRVVGKVDNLLVNQAAERVVYLDIEVDKSIIDANYDPYGRSTHSELREFVNKDGENHIIIPIGLVDLDENSKFVYTDMIDHRTFAETKRYRKGDNINRDYENQVMRSYERRSERNQNRDLQDTDLSDSLRSEISETRLREIIREEIRKYHQDSDKNTSYAASYENDDIYDNDDIEDAEIITDEDMRRRRENDDVYDDDHYYERREFDNDRFRKRTPGL